MKLFKKLMVCSLTVVAAMAMSLVAFGATPEATKKSIVDELNTAGVPANFVTQASNYLDKDDVTVTDAQAATIVAQIKEAKAIAGDTSFADLSTEQMTKIVDKMDVAAKAIGLNATFDATSKTVTVTDADGNVVFSASASTTTPENPIKTTGVGMNTTIAVIAALACALVACGVVVSKKTAAHAA